MDLKAYIAWILKSGKTIAITVIGFALLLLGLALIPLPGPWTIPLVLLGLAILGTEYAWARRALDETKRRARSASDRIRRKKRPE
jgi:CHASE2 domain-containing sensor protein